ncbi:hypothetical protein RI367_002389 [Sorochytrium milnesiophthora]
MLKLVLLMVSAAALARGAVLTKRGVTVDDDSDYHITVPIPLHPDASTAHGRFSTRSVHVDDFGFPLHRDEVAYKMHAYDKDFVLALKRADGLLSPQYQHVYQDQGRAREMRNGLEHCYYQGIVNDDPTTLATISTCDGLVQFTIIGARSSAHRGIQHGIIHISADERYSIHPVQEDGHDAADDNKAHQAHALIKHNKQDGRFVCPQGRLRKGNFTDILAVEQDVRSAVKRAVAANGDGASGNKTIELLLASDFERYQMLGTESETTLIEMANFINGLYERGGLLENGHIIKVTLAGVVTARTPLWVPNSGADVDVDDLLESWCSWRVAQLHDPANKGTFLANNDVGHMLTARRMTTRSADIGPRASIEGYAGVGVMCSEMQSCGVERGVKTAKLATQAMVIAHELGHNLGAQHDANNNECPLQGFIMERSSCKTCGGVATQWSDCSRRYVRDFFSRRDTSCLDNTPSQCGNGVVDEGEECDSGNTVQGSACCTPNCKLRPDADCDDANGPCCAKCRFVPAQTLCRKALTTDERASCDLPDYCSGTSAKCVNSVRTSGALCNINPLQHNNLDGTCNDGFCQSRENLCHSRGFDYDKACEIGREDSCLLYCKKRDGSCMQLTYGPNSPLSLVAPDYSPCTFTNGTSGTCAAGRCIASM